MSLAFKRNYHLIVFLILMTIALILGLGDQPIVAYTVPDDEPAMVHLAQAPIAGLLGALGIH